MTGIGHAVRARAPVSIPTLDDEMSRLVSAYGADAVKAAAKRATARKRGRKAEPDWSLLRPYIEKDAVDWLEGRSLRSASSIAKEVAAQQPGHNRDSTIERIRRKLRRSRAFWRTLIAYHLTTIGPLPKNPDLGRGRYPYSAHFRVLEELTRTYEGLDRILESDRQALEQYRRHYGEPTSSMTWPELERKARPLKELSALK